jgi:hypothetical protein
MKIIKKLLILSLLSCRLIFSNPSTALWRGEAEIEEVETIGLGSYIVRKNIEQMVTEAREGAIFGPLGVAGGVAQVCLALYKNDAFLPLRLATFGNGVACIGFGIRAMRDGARAETDIEKLKDFIRKKANKL